MRALLRIEGSDGVATTAPCGVKLHAPMVRVELDSEVALKSGIAYHMMLAHESGEPFEHVEVFNTDRPLSASISVKAIALTLEDFAIRGWQAWRSTEDRVLHKLAEAGSSPEGIALELGRTVEDVRRRAAEIDAPLARD